MVNNRKISKVVVGIFIICLVLTVGLTIHQQQMQKNKGMAVVMMGLPKEQAAGMQKELGKAFKYKSYLDKGDELVKQGKTSEAIKEYETAFSLAEISGAKAVAIFSIADAYEKERDYGSALKQIIIIRDRYVNGWAKEPVVERALYLDYASKGEYDLAVEHAQKALEEDTKLPNRPKEGSPDYIQRLSDLKAAKDYILSLKKQ